MSYYIDIIDTISPETKLVIEQASASGIILSWSGGDEKDNMDIVGSNIKIDMLSRTDKDAAFINFFTGDEHRFLVQIKNYADDAIIWQGYILPDQYSEPYKNVNFFVNFTATCGLGRLKGKYLPDDFYSEEKSVIQILCACLKLTGLEIPMYFSPAIENNLNKDWNTIYIDTVTFIDGKKRLDVYSILQKILQDTLCVCYQADNRWYVEGLNKRNIRAVKYEIYNTVTGAYEGSNDYSRLLKNITPLVTPNVTIIPPYNEIKVSHKKIEPNLPKTLSKEVNDGWAVVTGVFGEINTTDWMGHGGFYGKCKSPDYDVIVYGKGSLPEYGHGEINYPQDNSQWISLKEKVYVSKGQAVKFEFDFDIKRRGTTTENPSDMSLWKNPFKYEIIFNGAVLFSNFVAGPDDKVEDRENVFFNESANAKLEIEHIFIEEGLIDIKIYGPPGVLNDHKIEGILLRNISLGIIGFVEEEIETDLINGDFTVDKEIELTYADDKSGFSKGFRLAKLKNETTFYNEIEVPILYGFTYNSKYYSVVQLIGANLIAENKYATYKDSVLIEVKDVIYNWQNGEQMVIETAVPFTSGSFFVKKYAVDDVIGSRSHWTQWTDSVYKIENTSYLKTVANIYRRIFGQAVEKLDLDVRNSVKFNDIILFNYVSPKDFFVLNCSWNMDKNDTTLTLGRSSYKDSGSDPDSENVPPIVLAGDDIYIGDSDTSVTLLASAYDPDGYIASQKWTKTVGPFGDVIMTPNSLGTTIQNLTGDFYTYQIQVTDNDGASGFDTINIIRNKNYLVTLDLVEETIDDNPSHPSILRKYKLNIVPTLLPGMIVTFSGVISLAVGVSGTFGVAASAEYTIEKNGAIIAFNGGSGGMVVSDPLTINQISTDEIYISLQVAALAGDSGSGDNASATADIAINSATVTSGVGIINGLPITKTQTVSVSS